MILKSVTAAIKAVPLRVSLLAICALEIGALVSMVRERAAILKSPTVIELDVAPVDPRSLFRGDYVDLAYPAARLAMTPEDRRAADIGAGTVYAVLSKNGGGEWRPVRLEAQRPSSLQPGEVALKARTGPQPFAGSARNLRFGIETYFVPEGQGRAIEDKVRSREARVRVAVAADGTAAIKALVIGDTVLEEPAW